MLTSDGKQPPCPGLDFFQPPPKATPFVARRFFQPLQTEFDSWAR
jgi:hypothetical protein